MGLIGIFVHIIVTAFLLIVVGRLVSGVEVKNGKAAIWAAVALGLINAFVKPIIVFFTFPITLVTLGLFLLVINALMLMLAAFFVDGFEVKSFRTAFFGALMLTLLNWVVGAIFL